MTRLMRGFANGGATNPTSTPVFVAARREGTLAPALVSGTAIGARTDLDVFEATVGYDVRCFYGSTDWVNQAGVSVVWARRWW